MKLLLLLIALSVSMVEASESFFIEASNWFDGKKFNKGSKTYFHIENGKITAITKLKPSKEARIISAGDRFLLPGLTDGHTHVFLSSDPKLKSDEELLKKDLKKAKTDRLKQAQKTIDSYIESGFTQLLDLGNSGHFLDVELRKENTSLLTSGPGLAVQKAQFSKTATQMEVGQEYKILDFKKDLDYQLKEYLSFKVDYMKVFADNDPGDGQIDSVKLSLIKKWCDEHKLKMHVHATNAESLKQALLVEPDFIHHIYHFDSKMLDKMKESRALLVPTFLGSKLLKWVDEEREKGGDFVLQQKLLKLENVAFGSDAYYEIAGISRGRQAIEALLSLKNWGLSNEDVLIMATSRWNGRIREGIRGVIQVGAVADLIISGQNLDLNLNALEDIEKVILGGKLIYDRTRVKKRK